jgi:hypothetical protein
MSGASLQTFRASDEFGEFEHFGSGIPDADADADAAAGDEGWNATAEKYEKD